MSKPLSVLLAERLAALSMAVDIKEVSADDYVDWIGGQGKPRHILTLLARKITAEPCAQGHSLDR